MTHETKLPRGTTFDTWRLEVLQLYPRAKFTDQSPNFRRVIALVGAVKKVGVWHYDTSIESWVLAKNWTRVRTPLGVEYVSRFGARVYAYARKPFQPREWGMQLRGEPQGSGGYRSMDEAMRAAERAFMPTDEQLLEALGPCGK